MRAGQEVSIVNEKRALERLTGHPVLCELLHSGTFRVGAQTHQYIAVELADGKTIEDYVLELSAEGKRLPELEMLVVLDALLDLLSYAHDRKVIYNDVDAKHLYWNRDTYRLKLIDWGNAVLLDNDSGTASKASDAYQTAELIYFIMTGGKRLERRGTDAVFNLPDDVPPRIRSLLSRAVATEIPQRYQEVVSLRRDLADIRRPIEKTRDSTLERIRGRLATATTQEHFESLAESLREVSRLDPAHPPTYALLSEVEARLRQLSLQGDLDAARIYIESNNPGRASLLLRDIQARIGDSDYPLLTYLIEVSELLNRALLTTPPNGLAPALDALFKGDQGSAGRALVTTPESRPEAKAVQLLLAERLTQIMPGVTLLRPHLTRLDQGLALLGASRAGDRAILMRLIAPLDNVTERGVQPLRKIYVTLSDALSGFAERLPTDLQPVCGRAEQAATDISDLLEIVAANVLNDPSRAGNALRQAQMIDPANPAFEAINTVLSGFHSELDAIHQARPGGEILAWLVDIRGRLAGYADDIPDPRLNELIQRLDGAITHWHTATDSFAMGGKRPAMDAYTQAAETIHALNEPVARWFSEHARQIGEARYAEALHPNAALGKALSEGWDAWDRGRHGDAQVCARRALESAQTPGEAKAAERLIQLAEQCAAWLSSDGVSNAQTTERALGEFNALLTPEEQALQRKFTDQMPNATVYLKAVTRGLIDPFHESSSAAIRVLLVTYSLQGVIALIHDDPDLANFYKELASRTITSLPNARIHPIYAALESGITRRSLLITAAEELNKVDSVAGLAIAKPATRAPIAAAQLESAESAVRATEDAIRKWTDGDFRGAHLLLDTALEHATKAESVMKKDLSRFKTWLTGLNTTVTELATHRRTVEQAALIPADTPDLGVESALGEIETVTAQVLGRDTAALVRGWRETYGAILAIYQDDRFTKPEKLRLFDEKLNAFLIEKHPAYSIYRHWHTVIRNQPDTPLPPPPKLPPVDPLTDAPPSFVEADPPRARTLRSQPAAPVVTPSVAPAPTLEDQPSPAPPPPPRSKPRQRGLPIVPMIGAVVVLIAVVIGVIVATSRPPQQGGLTLTLQVTPTTQLVAIAPTETSSPIPPTQTPIPPSATPIPVTPTLTPIPPTVTNTPIRAVPTETRPFVTLPPFESPTPIPALVSTLPPVAVNPTLPPTTTPAMVIPSQLPGSTMQPLPIPTGNITATIPPNAAKGEYDMLRALTTLPSEYYTWQPTLFLPNAEGRWILGTTSNKASGNQVVRIGANTLAALYGVDASRKVVRVDAEVELIAYSRDLVSRNNVYFGVGFEASAGQQRAYAQANLAQSTAIAATLGYNVNGRVTVKSTKPGSPVKLLLSARRNEDRTVSLYADGQLLGTTPNAVYGPATAVNIILYTSAPSVLVQVNTLKVQIG
jgi:hypothetical protein